MKRKLGIFLALAVALPLTLMPAAVSANPPTVTVFTAGVDDNFALPTEPTSPSSNLLGAFSIFSFTEKDFDDPTINRFLLHTFTGLPEQICEATLEIHLRAGASGLSHNDALNLLFSGDDQILPPVGPVRWGRRIGTGHGVSGVFPFDWHSGKVDTMILDLSNLPLAVGQPSSASNLIPALNLHRFLDFLIQDDTDVDFMILTVTSVDPLGDLQDLIDLTNSLVPGDFSNPNHQNTLVNMVNAIINGLDLNDVASICDAIDMLTNNILPKTDGVTPPPDWVTDPTAQQQLEDAINAIIATLQGLADSLGGCQ